MELPKDDVEPRPRLLLPQLLRQMYRCGLELAANESAVFLLAASPERTLELIVRNGRDGVVDILCSDDQVAAELRTHVGFHVALTRETANPPNAAPHRR